MDLARIAVALGPDPLSGTRQRRHSLSSETSCGPKGNSRADVELIVGLWTFGFLSTRVVGTFRFERSRLSIVSDLVQ